MAGRKPRGAAARAAEPAAAPVNTRPCAADGQPVAGSRLGRWQKAEQAGVAAVAGGAGRGRSPASVQGAGSGLPARARSGAPGGGPASTKARAQAGHVFCHHSGSADRPPRAALYPASAHAGGVLATVQRPGSLRSRAAGPSHALAWGRRAAQPARRRVELGGSSLAVQRAAKPPPMSIISRATPARPRQCGGVSAASGRSGPVVVCNRLPTWKVSPAAASCRPATHVAAGPLSSSSLALNLPLISQSAMAAGAGFSRTSKQALVPAARVARAAACPVLAALSSANSSGPRSAVRPGHVGLGLERSGRMPIRHWHRCCTRWPYPATEAQRQNRVMPCVQPGRVHGRA